MPLETQRIAGEGGGGGAGTESVQSFVLSQSRLFFSSLNWPMMSITSKCQSSYLAQIRQAYELLYGPFERYSTVETVNLKNDMFRIYIRPVHNELRELRLRFSSPEDENMLIKLSWLIMHAALSQLVATALLCSTTHGKFDLFVDMNDDGDDHTNKGACVLDITSKSMRKCMDSIVFHIAKPYQLRFIYDAEKNFIFTSKSIIVNAYKDPTYIVDKVLDDEYGDIRSDYVPLLEQEKAAREQSQKNKAKSGV